MLNINRIFLKEKLNVPDFPSTYEYTAAGGVVPGKRKQRHVRVE
jgi:hypothetical protein